MLPADPTLSVAERVDAACDRFESEWKGGVRPKIDDYVAAAPESDRAELRQALLALEIELQGRSEAETSVSRSSVRTKENANPAATVDHKQSIQSSVNTIGRFEIRGVLGSGAFGKVYRAFDPQLGREVAIKVPLASTVQSEKERAQFLKEARSAATINHPNVCQVHEVGEAGGRPYIVMALVRGQSLADTIKARKEPLPEKQTALVVRKIAMALAAAHDSGIVHRDLKPANVMFDRERKDIVVMDFGLARGPKLGDARGTQSGVIMGTPAYMSPEQARGDSKGVGPAGDIFSLGVILYELLSGTRPFTGTATEVIGKILHVEPESPSAVRPEVDPRLEAVCLKAMAKDPAARFASMKEFAAAIDAVLRQPVPTSPAMETTKARATRREGDDESTSTRNNLAEVFAAISDDRKLARAETAAVVEAAIAKHRTPRWVFLLVGLIFVGGMAAMASVIFFTRSDNAKVNLAVIINDVDLKDQSLSFFLDDEPIAADILATPVELKPGVHIFTVKRGKDIVKRVEIRVERGKTTNIKVEDITPPPVEEPVKQVKSNEWQDLLGEVDAAKLPPAWKMQGGKLVGQRDAGGNPKWLMWEFGKGVAGDYDLEFDFRCLDITPVLLFIPLNEATICAEFTGGGSALQTIDGKPADEGKGLVNFAPGTSNQQARATNNTLHSVTTLVRQKGADVDVVVKLDGVEVGHFIGARSRLSQPDWIKPAPGQIKVAATPWKKGVPGWLEVHKLRIKRLASADDLTGWQGRWQCITENSWGKVVYENDRTGKGPVQIISGNTRELNKVSANNAAPPGISRFRINDTVTPKTFDCDEFGPGKWRQSGIYEFSGDRLRLVYRFAKDAPPVRATWTDIGKGDVHYYEFERIPDDGFVPLFNGKDLTGWEVTPRGNERWSVSDGVVSYRGGPRSHLVTTKDYQNFHLKAEIKMNRSANSGIGFWCEPNTTGDYPIGFEVEASTTQSLFVGSVLRFNPAGWAEAFHAPKEYGLQPNEWCSLEIVVDAGRVRTIVNGIAGVNAVLPTKYKATGRIALQSNDPNTVVEFRNIRIKELSADGFVPLFNGKDLTGWKTHESQPGNWKVVDNVIVCGSDGTGPTHLYSARDDYKNFHFRMDVRVKDGSTGAMYRAPFGPTLGVKKEWVAGYNAKFDATRRGGIIVDQDRVLHRLREIDVKDGEWAKFEIIVQGDRHIVKLNGETTADYTDPDLRYRSGHIVLQKHGTKAEVAFRNIEIKETQ